MTDRDHFAAAALTGLVGECGYNSPEDVAGEAYALADAMLRERERVTEPLLKEKQAEVSAAPVSRPPETRASFSATNHDAAPAARAQLPEADHAACRSRESDAGTGGTTASACDGAVSPSGSGSGGSLSRSAPERQSPASECGGGEPLDDCAPTRDNAPGGRGRDTQEPVAWAVMLAGDERIYDVYAIEEDAKAIDEAVTGNHGIVPLYRQPALTAEECEAIELAAYEFLYHQDPGGRAQWIREQLLGLLARTK